VGGVAALSAIVCGDMMVQFNIPPIPAVLIGLLFGAVVGFINGLFIERFKLNSIVMTLATWWIMLGIAEGITQGQMPGGFPNSFQSFGQIRILGFLVGDYYALALVVIMGVVFGYRRFGYHILATGGDREASRRKGIRVERVGIVLFTFAGLVSAFAGICFSAQLGSAQTNAYYNLALETVAAAVIGGAGLAGGEGSIVGTVFGLLLLNITTNALIFLGFSALWSQAIYGVVLVAAITIDNVALRLRARRALRSTLRVGSSTADDDGVASRTAEVEV
jgi:ribose transport system permease protein